MVVVYTGISVEVNARPEGIEVGTVIVLHLHLINGIELYMDQECAPPSLDMTLVPASRTTCPAARVPSAAFLELFFMKYLGEAVSCDNRSISAPVLT